MGKYYLFKIRIVGKDIEQIYKPIESDSIEYITYDKFLNRRYGVSIVENEDYTAYVNKDTAIIILNEELFDKYDLGNVFDVLYNGLYMKGEEYEKNNCG